MADLIDRGEVIEAFIKIANSESNKRATTSWAHAYEDAANMVELMPTAERRGQWKECKSAIPITMETLHIADGIIFCSECEHLALQRLIYEDGNGDLRFIKSNYCPNCGANMED